MRRVLALFLVLAFSFPLIAPAVASSSGDSTLPACCRRDGKHHCMDAVMLGHVPSRYTTVSEKCPCPPFAGLLLMLPHAFAGPLAARLLTGVTSQESVVREAEAGYRISAHRSRQKRGPPRNLAL